MTPLETLREIIRVSTWGDALVVLVALGKLAYSLSGWL